MQKGMSKSNTCELMEQAFSRTGQQHHKQQQQQQHQQYRQCDADYCAGLLKRTFDALTTWTPLDAARVRASMPTEFFYTAEMRQQVADATMKRLVPLESVTSPQFNFAQHRDIAESLVYLFMNATDSRIRDYIRIFEDISDAHKEFVVSAVWGGRPKGDSGVSKVEAEFNTLFAELKDWNKEAALYMKSVAQPPPVYDIRQSIAALVATLHAWATAGVESLKFDFADFGHRELARSVSWIFVCKQGLDLHGDVAAYLKAFSELSAEHRKFIEHMWPMFIADTKKAE